MPFEHLRYGVDVWKGHFWNNLIGFSHQGRNHASLVPSRLLELLCCVSDASYEISTQVVRQVDGEETTLYSATFLSPERLAGKKSFYSIVLT